MAMNQNNQDYDEIDLLKIGKALWHYAGLIVAAMLICSALAFSYAKFMITPKYQASSLLYINNVSISQDGSKSSISTGDLNAQSGLTDTYSAILKSRTTLETAIDRVNLDISYSDLSNRISVSSVNDTGVLRITTTNEDPGVAAQITNALTDIMSERVVSIVEGSSVEIIDYAVAPKSPSSPNIMRYAMLGLIFGLVISALIVVLRTLMDYTIRGEDFLLENYKDIPVLTMVPDLNTEKHGGYYGYGNAQK